MTGPDTPTASWQDISILKQAHRDSQIPPEWTIPNRLLPKDPPLLQYGPQSVLHLPSNLRTIVSALASGRLTALEVTTSFVKRSAIAQQLTNCITEPLLSSAISRAKELDAYLTREGKPIGPLHGLPISVKDSFDIEGVDSSIGIASLCFKPATSNSPLISLLLSLGCIIIAKTNVPQTLNSLDSVNNVFGRTMNPINRLCTAGGSSGGEGVMVAMRGSMLGWGADTGGSIRIPSFCNGIFGVKSSFGRIPAGGGPLISTDGVSRCGVGAVAGPLARSIEDIEFVMNEIVPRAWLWAEDCIPSKWTPSVKHQGSGPNDEFVFGILRGDGNCDPHPPLMRLLDEVRMKLSQYPNTKAIELPTPKAWTKCQGVMAKLMSIDGGEVMADLLEATGEPLVPWMKGKFKRVGPKTLPEVAELQARRSHLEKEMIGLWIEDGGKGGKKSYVDAIICLVAPHPVPEIERWNASGMMRGYCKL